MQNLNTPLSNKTLEPPQSLKVGEALKLRELTDLVLLVLLLLEIES